MALRERRYRGHLFRRSHDGKLSLGVATTIGLPVGGHSGTAVWSCGCEQVHVGVGAHTGRTGNLALSGQGATTRSDDGGPHGVVCRVSGGRSGHIGMDGEPGLSQLRYYLRHFLAEFGTVGGILAVAGLVSVMARDTGRALLLMAFPVALIALLAAQRVHFPRNVLAIHPLYAVLVGHGLIALYQTWVRVAEHRGWSRRHRQYATVALSCALAVATSLPSRILAQIRVPADSRNLARSWVADHVPSDWTVVVPAALGFDYRDLEDRGFNVVEVDVSSPHQQRAMVGSLRGQAVAFVPTWGIDRRFDSETNPQAMNAAVPAMRVLREFGDNPVLLNSRATAPGNPKFRIVSR